jgi:FkbM family methyltransferase
MKYLRSLYFLLHNYKNRFIVSIFKRQYSLTYDNIETKFLTTNSFSRSWFYPRYENGKIHEPLATQMLIEAIQNNDIVVDVGANLGWFTCIAASQNPKCFVYSFEMDAQNAELCRKNIRLNKLKNVVLENCAVSNSDAEVSYSKNNDIASATHRIGQPGNLLVKKNAIKLDSYFLNKSQPNIVKIDVEGAEQLVLEGMRGILNSLQLRVIFIEIHPEWLRELGGSLSKVCEIIKESGFLLYSMEHRSFNGEQLEVDEQVIESSAIGGRMFVAKKSLLK